MMNTTDKREYLRIGAEFWNQRRFQDAYEAYNKAVEIDPNFAEGYGGRGYALQDLGDLEGALRDYTKAVELDSNYADGYMNRAVLRFKLNEINLALQDAIEAKCSYLAQNNIAGHRRASAFINHISPNLIEENEIYKQENEMNEMSKQLEELHRLARVAQAIDRKVGW